MDFSFESVSGIRVIEINTLPTFVQPTAFSKCCACDLSFSDGIFKKI
jgi:hypothetical protein